MDLFQVLVFYANAQALLQGHGQLHDLQGVGLQVLHQIGLQLDLLRVAAQGADNDVPYILKGDFHVHRPSFLNWSRLRRQ